MGTVWRAHDQLLDRPVAAKELHILTHGDEEHRIRVRRAIREARAVARVPHPHVVGVHDLVEAEDRLWIVMELVNGPSLAHRTAETGPLTPQHTATLGLQLLDALEAVHNAGTCTGTSSPPTSCCAATAARCSPTSASRPWTTASS